MRLDCKLLIVSKFVEYLRPQPLLLMEGLDFLSSFGGLNFAEKKATS